MTDVAGPLQQLAALLGLIWRYRLLLVGSVAIFGVGGVVLALLTPKTYQAHQPFLIRDDTSGRILSGRFQSLEALKNASEMVQEIATHPDVLRQALEDVGPTGWWTGSRAYPTQGDLEDFRGDVWISSPSGNELGKSEVIHLNVKAPSRERAKRLVQLISQGMIRQLRQVRGQRAASIEAELRAALENAEHRLNEVTARVVSMERTLGEDLIELRAMLDDKFSSEGALLRPFLLAVDGELLSARNQLLQIEQDIKFFQSAQENPANLLGMPNDLLDQYQSLRELKLGLVQSQLRFSDVAAKYQVTAPAFREAQQSLRTIEKQIRQELEVSIETAQARQRFTESRIESLSAERMQRVTQMARLAELRAPYQNLIAQQSAATASLQQSHDEFAQSQAALAAALQVNLLTAMEDAQVGTRPVGLSRTLMVLGAAGCGLFIGLGLMLFLSAQPDSVSQAALARWEEDDQAA